MKRKFCAAAAVVILCLFAVFPVFAGEIPAERQLARLVDEAGLLEPSEERELLTKLDEISERQNFDVVVVTVNSLDGKSAQDYADDFYDYNGYGMGSGRDGVLLLVSMGEREWHITTTGYGITAFTDAGITYISDRFLSDLSDGEYFDAFETYADLCDDFVTQAREGEAYDSGSMPKEKLSPLCLPAAFIIGLIAAFIPLTVMKRKLKTVRRQAAASGYVSEEMQLTESRDIFLYHTISRVPKPQEKSSGGGGSSIHVGSSGTSHGGGGGRF